MNDTAINEARFFAVTAHEACGQVRKYNGEPYWYHVSRVAKIVEEHGGTPAMIAAALLHDVVEDTHITSGHIHGWFGGEIGLLVDQLTNDKTVDRKTRKALEMERFRSASGAACTIKLADILDNGKDFLECGDAKAIETFMTEKRELVKVLTRGHPQLWDHVNNMIEGYFDGKAKN